MKTPTKIIIALAALGTSAWMVLAQDAGGSNNQPSGGSRPARHRPPPPLVIGALDANHNHVIDADEIANASAALKALDKNGDGKLTPDEFIGKLPPPDDAAGDAGRPAGPPPALE